MSLRKLLAAVMVVSMVFGLVGTTVFAQDASAEGVARLQSLGVVKGDETGNLRLEDPINRAEVMAVLIRAMGLEEYASLLGGTQPFSDVPGPNGEFAWAVGYVALGKNKGLTTGYEDGTFKPGNNVTYAEVAALLARATGLAPAAAAWPQSYIKAFVDAGLVPAGVDLAAQASAPAVRGMVFVLADAAFMKVRDANNKNLYQRVFDDEAPVVSVDAVAPQTTAKTVKVSGSVTGAEAAFVNGAPLELAADGAFTADIELKLGANEIVVTAVDAFSNEGTAKVAVERINTAAAAIVVESSLAVAAGAEAALAVAVNDSNGEAIEGAEVTATVSPETLGTFANGTFKAGEKAGSGTLTLASGDVTATVAVTVNPAALAKIEVSSDKSSIAKGGEATLSVKGFDAFGNEVSGLTPELSVAPAGAYIVGGNKFIGSTSGKYTVTAKVGEFTATTTVGIFGDVADVKILSAPDTIVGNAASVKEVKVGVVDEFGNIVAGYDLEINLAVAGNAAIGTLDTVDVDDSDSATLEAEDGLATFYLIANTTAGGSILELVATADVDADGWDEGVDNLESEAKEVTAVRPQATSLALTLPKYLTANEESYSETLYATVVDQDGEDYTDDSDVYEVTWTIVGPAHFVVDGVSKKTAKSTTVDGSASIALYPDRAQTGAVNISAVAEDLQGATGTLTAALAEKSTGFKVTAAKESQKVDVGATVGDGAKWTTSTGTNFVKFTVQILDAKGVPVRQPADKAFTLKFGGLTSSNYDKVEIWTLDADGNPETLLGTPNSTTFEFSDATNLKVGEDKSAKSFAIVATKFVGDLSVTAKAAGLASASANTTFKAGSAYFYRFTSTITYAGVTNPTATATVQLYDRWGNKAPTSGMAVQVYGDTTRVTINGAATSLLKPAKVSTDDTGAAVLNLQGRAREEDHLLTIVDVVDPADDTRNFWVHADTPTYDEFTMSVRSALPTSEKVAFYDGSNVVYSVKAGSSVYLRVRITDQLGDFLDESAYLTVSAPKGNADIQTGTDPETSEPIYTDLYNDGYGITDDELQFTVVDVNGVDWLESTVPIRVKKYPGVGITVSDDAAPSGLEKTATIGVSVDDVATAVLVEAPSVADTDPHFTIKGGETVGPYTLRLADQWGNVRNSGTPVTVYFDYTGARVTVRTSMSGDDLDSVQLQSSLKVYLHADATGLEVDASGEIIIYTDSIDTIYRVTVQP